MRRNANTACIPGCVLLALASSCMAGQRDLSIAEVHAYRERLTDVVRYTYVVTNKGSAPITALEVGYDYYLGEPELRGTRPIRVSSLPGWTSRVTGMEESDLYSISWETGSAPVQPGQMRAGFIVEVPNHHQQFLGSHWTITADGPIVSASDRVVHIEGPAPGDTADAGGAVRCAYPATDLRSRPGP